MNDELRFLFYAATSAAIGEFVVRTAAILLALSAIVTVTTKTVRWCMRVSHDLHQLIELTRTGDERLRRIEDELTPRRQPPPSS